MHNSIVNAIELDVLHASDEAETLVLLTVLLTNLLHVFGSYAEHDHPAQNTEKHEAIVNTSKEQARALAGDEYATHVLKQNDSVGAHHDAHSKCEHVLHLNAA